MIKCFALSLMAIFFNIMNVNAALPSTTSCQKCHKKVAVFFQQCSRTVTHGGIVQNPDGLNKCKDAAKVRKEACKTVCSK